MAKARGLILGLALTAVASCAMLKGVYGVAERAAPAAVGAGGGALLGGPAGAVLGAGAGSAVAQAARGNERSASQDEAVRDLIRTGGNGAAELTLIGRIAAWVADFTELAVLILVGWTLVFWQLKKRPSDIIGAVVGFFRRAPSPTAPRATSMKKPRAPRKR